MNTRTGDFIASIFFFLLALYVYYESLGLEGDGPEKMPQLIAAILGVSAILLIVRTLRAGEVQAKILGGASWASLLILIVAWLATMLLAETIGFFVLLGAFMAVVNWAMAGRPSGRFELLKIAAYATVTTSVFWLIFAKALHVTPPSGILF